MANISDVIEKFLIDAIGGDRSIVIVTNLPIIFRVLRAKSIMFWQQDLLWTEDT